MSDAEPAHQKDDLRFYYYRDTSQKHQPPLVTLCRLISDEMTVYAWAICSPTETCHRKHIWDYDFEGNAYRKPGGNAIAAGRAYRVLRQYRKAEASHGECEYRYGITPGYKNVLYFNRPIERLEAIQSITRANAYVLYELAEHGYVCNLPDEIQPLTPKHVYGALPPEGVRPTIGERAE